METAVNSLMSDFRLGGRIIVKGVQELPQQNAAVADLQFDNFEYGITNEGMTTISTKIPDTLFLHARSIAECEEITLDQFIALALTSQITSWETGQSFAKRAARRDWNKARELLAKAPDIEPDLIDAL